MDKLTSKMSEVTIADSPRKQGVVQKKSVNLTVISSNMQTSNGCVYLHIKTMNELRIRTGDPILISPSSSKDSTVVGLHQKQSSQKTVSNSLISSLTFFDIIMDSTVLENCPVSFGETVTINNLSSFYEASKITVQRVKSDLLSTNSVSLLKDIAIAQVMITQQLIDRYFVVGNTFLISMYGKPYQFQIINAQTEIKNAENCVYKVSHSTVFTIEGEEPPVEKKKVKEVDFSWESIGGLKEQVQTIREMVETTIKSPEMFQSFGLKPPRGILMFGPPGTGKTLIAKVVAKQCGAKAFVINGPEFISSFYGESESKLRDLFAQAEKEAPSLIFIDELDAVCSKREETNSEVEKRVVSTLLTVMDGAGSTDNRVVVLGATNRVESIDAALRRPGRFDREIEIGIPNSQGRKEILSVYLKRMPHCLSDAEITHVASITHGYVGADLSALCKESGLKTLKRVWDGVGKPPLEKLTVSIEDVLSALNDVRPSAMREVVIDVPKVYWTDIGGYENVKQKLKESVQYPIKHPDAFVRLGITPPKGVLLYGPPGCSKTLMAKALATESGLNFIAIKGPELYSKWVGESERAVREVFRKARAAAPSVIFFDEIDALASTRGAAGEGVSVHDRVLTQLLNEMDGIVQLKNVTIVAATNRPDLLDKALLRPGRIDAILYVSPPDYNARCEILRLALRKIPHSDEVKMEEISSWCEGYSGAEVTVLCKEAAMNALKENPADPPDVHRRHFMEALQTIKSGITFEMLSFYQKWQQASENVVVM